MEAAKDGEFARHLHLLRILCRGLDPQYEISIRDRDAYIKRTALIELLGVPSRIRAQIGRAFGAQRYSVSRLIGSSARRKALDGDLPPLSAFKEEAWLAVDTGWEIDEFNYRRKLEVERAQAEAELDRDWPVSEGDLALRRKSVEFERLNQIWEDQAEARRRNRPGLRSKG
jgi:hypothetical protein